MARISEAERDSAIADLRDILRDGDTVYTILRHKSASGMTRHISLVIFRDDEPAYITYKAHKAMGYGAVEGPYTALVVKGTGMDMGFDAVDALGSALGLTLRHRWL